MVKSSSGKFFKALITLSVFLIGVVLLIAKWLPEFMNVYHFLVMIGFLVLVIAMVHLILLKVSEGKPQKFIKVFMLATMAKLILFLGFILTMAYLYRDQAGGLLIGFMILYLCYTTLEVSYLRKHLNSQST